MTDNKEKLIAELVNRGLDGDMDAVNACEDRMIRHYMKTNHSLQGSRASEAFLEFRLPTLWEKAVVAEVFQRRLRRSLPRIGELGRNTLDR